MGFFEIYLAILLLLPCALVSAATWAWRSRLTQRGNFIALGLLSLYFFAGFLLYLAFDGVGIAGGVPTQVTYLRLFPMNPFTADMTTLLLVYLVGSVGILLLLRRGLSIQSCQR